MFLSGSAAAAGIATINSIGNLGGFVGPAMIGWIKDQTGSFAGGLYFVGGLLVLSAVLTLLLSRARERSSPSQRRCRSSITAASVTNGDIPMRDLFHRRHPRRRHRPRSDRRRHRGARGAGQKRGGDVALQRSRHFDWGSDYYKKHGVMMPADGLDRAARSSTRSISARSARPTCPTTSRCGACACRSARASTSTPMCGRPGSCRASPRRCAMSAPAISTG